MSEQRVDKKWQAKGIEGYSTDAILGTLGHYGVTVTEGAFKELAATKYPMMIAAEWAPKWKGTGQFSSFLPIAIGALWARWLPEQLTPEAVGVPPEQVVGSSIRTKYEVRDGDPVIVRLPEMDFVDDGPGKPVGIHRHIGRRPLAAFGNSDGDFEMLEWTTAGPGPRLGLLLHHDDAEREVAYDRASAFGRLDRGLEEAPKRGWVVVGMKRDWQRVFPP